MNQRYLMCGVLSKDGFAKGSIHIQALTRNPELKVTVSVFNESW
jgi:hypothetical protein